MLGYRFLSGDSLFINRSFCPNCRSTIAWYDLIPLLSWVALQGKCRSCSKPISWLYPFIELITVFIFSGLVVFIPQDYWFGYGILFSALIIVIRTDLQAMLISRYCSLFLIPVGWVLSYFELLPITLFSSVIGSLTGYLCLLLVSSVFYLITKKKGIGEGDIELLGCIGAFTGLVGWWLILLIASMLGSVIGITILIWQKIKQFVATLQYKSANANSLRANGEPVSSFNKVEVPRKTIRTNNPSLKLPFGPFLAAGTIIYILFEPWIHSLLLYTI